MYYLIHSPSNIAEGYLHLQTRAQKQREAKATTYPLWYSWCQTNLDSQRPSVFSDRKFVLFLQAHTVSHSECRGHFVGWPCLNGDGKGRMRRLTGKVPGSSVEEQFELIPKGPGAAALPCSKSRISVHQDVESQKVKCGTFKSSDRI